MYKQLKEKDGSVSTEVIKRIQDNAFIPVSTENRDYQEYLRWLAEGNEPLPADE